MQYRYRIVRVPYPPNPERKKEAYRRGVRRGADLQGAIDEAIDAFDGEDDKQVNAACAELRKELGE